MRHRSLICCAAAAVLVIFGGFVEIRSQSGRGRPRVPVPTQPATPQPSVKIPESTVVVKQEQAGNAARFVLRNGMTVLLSEQHTEPYAAVVAYFGTKRLTESEYYAGRVLQKALIAGDLQTAPFKNARIIRTFGGKLTARAGRDYSYFCTLTSSKHVADVLVAQSEMLTHPALSADGARRAAAVVDAENRLNCESAADYSIERVAGLAASIYETGSPGSSDIQGGASQERLFDFYKGYYRPDNLVLSVVGDISTFDTLVQIERLFGDFGAAEPVAESGDKSAPSLLAKPSTSQAASASMPQKASEPSIPRESSNGTQKLLYLENRGRTNQSIVTVGYRMPGLKSDEWAATEVLAALLGQGRGSALSLALLFSQGIVSHVSSDYSAGPTGGLLSIQLWLQPGAIDKAEASLFKEIDRVIKAKPDIGEVARARSVAEIKFGERFETFAGAAIMMAEHGTASDSIPTAADLVSRIRSVKPEDVQLAAARYLALSNASIHEYEPLNAPARTFDSAGFARTVISWAPGLAQSASAPAAPNQPAGSPGGPKASDKEKAGRYQAEAEAQNVQPLPVKDFSTLNGPKVFVREDHSRPQVTIAILFLGGRISETESNAGITDLMLRVILCGTPRVTKEQAAIAMDKLGGDIRLINEPDYFGFVVTCLSSSGGEALRLIRDLIEIPAFRDVDVERARQEQLGLIWAERNSDRERSKALMLETMFTAHPYAMGSHGQQATIEKLKADDLKEWYTRTIKTQFPLAIIVGDTDGSALVSEGIAGEFKRRDLAEALKARVPARPSNAEKAEQGDCPVTIQYLGFPGPKQDSNDLAALSLIEESLNGAAGAFEEDLVYKQGAAWAVSLDYRAMMTGGLLYAGIESAPDERQHARAAAMSMLQHISASGLSSSEFDAARELAATAALEELAAPQRRALAYAEALYSRREPSRVDNLPDALQSITAADVKRAAAYLKPAGFSVGMIQGTGAPRQGAPSTQ